MKKALLTLALVVATAVSSFAQGTLVFQNLGNNASRVTLPDGGLVPATSTSGIVAGLYWLNPANDTFELIGAPAPFQLAGIYIGGQRETPNPGTFTFQVRAWERSFNGQDVNSYEEAANITGILWGSSPSIDVKTGDPGAALPATGMAPFMQPFQLAVNPVPEPSTIALGVLGIGALLLLRRRK